MGALRGISCSISYKLAQRYTAATAAAAAAAALITVVYRANSTHNVLSYKHSATARIAHIGLLQRGACCCCAHACLIVDSASQYS
jgi:hypothetical protein